jgi:hypothetical protein
LSPRQNVRSSACPCADGADLPQLRGARIAADEGTVGGPGVAIAGAIGDIVVLHGRADSPPQCRDSTSFKPHTPARAIVPKVQPLRRELFPTTGH